MKHARPVSGVSTTPTSQTFILKVNRKLKKWYDHEVGKGGSVIDFAFLYPHCPLHEIAQKTKTISLFNSIKPQRQTFTMQMKKDL